MNYNYLRYFSVLAEVEHYTTAAARLGISQPSLSSAIHNLENELGGVELFEKVGRNVRLTQEGKYYKRQVDEALAQLNTASVTIRQSREKAPVVVRLGVVSGSLKGTVGQLVTRYWKENSRVRFQITEDSGQGLMDLLRQKKLDMAIVDTTDRDRTLHFRKLGQQAFYAAVPYDHSLAECAYIEPDQLMADPQIVINDDVSRSFTQWASGMHTQENVVCSVNTAQAALELVASGLGVAFVPDDCCQKRSDLKYIPVKNWHQALYMCTLYDKWLEPLIWDFCEVLVNGMRSAQEL